MSAGEVREIRWLRGIHRFEDGTFDVIIEPDMNEDWNSYDLKDEIAKAFEVPSNKVRLYHISNSNGQLYLCFEVPAW